MPTGFRHNLFARFWNPTTLAISLLSLVSILVIFVSIEDADILVKLLPVLAVAASLLIYLIPQKRMSFLILAALAVSIPFAHFAMIVSGGVGVQWAHLFGTILIIHFAMKFLLGKPLRVVPATPWVLALLGASLLSSIAITGQPYIHGIEFWKSEVQLIFFVLMFIAITQIRLETRQLNFIIKLMILLSILVALYGMYQLLARFLGLPFGTISLTNPSLSGPDQNIRLLRNFARAASIFSEPSYFGHYLITMFTLTLTAAMHNSRYFGRRWILLAVLFIQAVGLIISQSMGSYYIFAQLILIMFLLERAAQKFKISITFLTIIGIGVVLITFMETVSGFPIVRETTGRLVGLYNFAVLGDPTYLVLGESLILRIETAKVGVQVWFDNLFIGVGLGSYTLISAAYGNINPKGWSANTLVNTLSEMGTIGFIALLGIALSSLRALRNIFRRPIKLAENDVNSSEYETLMLIARMMFYLVLVEMLYFHVINSFFWPSTWFYLGLGGAVVLTARKLRKQIQMEQQQL